MAWCPNCKSEYEPHVKKCADCGIELIEELFAEPKSNEDNPIEMMDFNNSECSILINVPNAIEADMIISRLMSEGIPAYKGYQAIGEYLNIAFGFNYQGVDIYVPTELIQSAQEIISTEVSVDNEDKNEDEALEKEGKAFRSKSIFVFRVVLFIILVVPMILYLIYKLS